LHLVGILLPHINFLDSEKSKNFTNDTDLIGVVTVAREENNEHAGTNHRLSIFMKSFVEGNGTHLPRRVGVRECVFVCVCARARVGHWNSDSRPLEMRTDEEGLQLRSPDGEKRSGSH